MTKQLKLDRLTFSAPVELIASADGDGDKDKQKRWRSRAYNGGEMRPESPRLDAPLVLDMSGLTFEDKIVANLHHDDEQPVGHVERHSVNDGVDLEGVVSAGGVAAAQFVESQSGPAPFPWRASLEADQMKIEKLSAGKSETINGRKFTGPLYVARRANVYGVAFLAKKSADRTTNATLAAGAALSNGEEIMAFEKWVEELGLKASELNDKQRAKLEAAFKAEELKAGDGGDKDQKLRASAAFDGAALDAKYAAHVAGVEKALKAAEDRRVPTDKLADLRAKALEEAVTLKASAASQEFAPARFEVDALDLLAAHKRRCIEAEAPKGPAIHAGNHDVTGDILMAAACQSLGFADNEKKFPDQVLQAAHSEFRGRLSLGRMILIAAERNGYTAGRYADWQTCNQVEALAWAFPPVQLRAAGSVLSLPTIFSNLANKSITDGFAEEESPWRDVSRVESVTNFFKRTVVRLLDNFEYEKLAPDGTMRHGQVGEESYTHGAETVAKMFSLTREDLINDDLGAFNRIRLRLGLGAAKKLQKMFWTKFLGTGAATFFTAARGNYITGASTVLDADGFEEALIAFRDMRTTAVPPATVGERIGGNPSILMAPPELEGSALRLMAQIQPTKASDVNPWANRCRVVTVSQLSDSTYTGYSAKAWYLMRSPTIYPAMVVSALNGNIAPTVVSAEAPLGRLGVDFAGYADVGVDFAEWLCGVKSKGEA